MLDLIFQMEKKIIDLQFNNYYLKIYLSSGKLPISKIYYDPCFGETKLEVNEMIVKNDEWITIYVSLVNCYLNYIRRIDTTKFPPKIKDDYAEYDYIFTNASKYSNPFIPKVNNFPNINLKDLHSVYDNEDD